MLGSIRSRLSGLLPGTTERRVQTADHAAAWARHNDDVLADHDGGARLWIALGDSTSQGIGATHHLAGWVGQTLDLLRAHDDTQWQVVNLSVTGARIVDVLDRQVSRLPSLPPAALVTCAVGANDMLRGRATATIATLDRLLDALPDQTVVATIPRGVRERVARAANDRIRAACATGDLRLADVWAHTGAPWADKYSADGFHPNDRGYREWVEAFATPLDLPFSTK